MTYLHAADPTLFENPDDISYFLEMLAVRDSQLKEEARLATLTLISQYMNPTFIKFFIAAATRAEKNPYITGNHPFHGQIAGQPRVLQFLRKKSKEALECPVTNPQ